VAVKEGYGLMSYGTLHPVRKSSLAFEYNQMAIYRTRYREPKQGCWIGAWTETRVGAEMPRAGVERRYAPRKLKIAVERFEMKSEQARAREVSERTRGGVRKP